MIKSRYYQSTLDLYLLNNYLGVKQKSNSCLGGAVESLERALETAHPDSCVAVGR
jgi:hypothetical protein